MGIVVATLLCASAMLQIRYSRDSKFPHDSKTIPTGTNPSLLPISLPTDLLRSLSPLLHALTEVSWCTPAVRQGVLLLEPPPYLNATSVHACEHETLGDLKLDCSCTHRQRHTCTRSCTRSCSENKNTKKNENENENENQAEIKIENDSSGDVDGSESLQACNACDACDAHMSRVALRLWSALGSACKGKQRCVASCTDSYVDPCTNSCTNPCVLKESWSKKDLMQLSSVLEAADAPHALAFAEFYEINVVAEAVLWRLKQSSHGFCYCRCLASLCLDNGAYSIAASLVQTETECEALLNLLAERATSSVQAGKRPKESLELQETVACLRHAVRPAQLSAGAQRLLQLSALLHAKDICERLQASVGVSVPLHLLKRLVFIGDAVQETAHIGDTRSQPVGLDGHDNDKLELSSKKRKRNHKETRPFNESSASVPASVHAWKTLDILVPQPALDENGLRWISSGRQTPQKCVCSACANAFGWEVEHGTDDSFDRLESFYAWGLDPPRECIRAIASAWIDVIDTAFPAGTTLHGVEDGGLVSWCFVSRTIIRLRSVAPNLQTSATADLSRCHTALSALHPSPRSRVMVCYKEQELGVSPYCVYVHASAILADCAVVSSIRRRQEDAAEFASSVAAKSIATLSLSQQAVLAACESMLFKRDRNLIVSVSTRDHETDRAVRMILASMWHLKAWTRGPHAATGPALRAFVSPYVCKVPLTSDAPSPQSRQSPAAFAFAFHLPQEKNRVSDWTDIEHARSIPIQVQRIEVR